MSRTYLVWCHEKGKTREQARRVDAQNPQHAAQVWARDDDAWSNDYSIAKGVPTEVTVAEDRADSPEQQFSVRGEARPYYYALAIHPKETPNG